VNAKTRLKRLDAELRKRALTQSGPLYFSLHEWSDGPIGYGPDESTEQDEAAAIERLIAVGKIKERDRERVVFIVRAFIDGCRNADGTPNIIRFPRRDQ
jgi:hypothetical protein